MCTTVYRQDRNKAHETTFISPTPLGMPKTPWSKVAIHAGPFANAPQHQRFVTTAIDRHTKFPEVLLSNRIMSGNLISWLQEVFAYFGNPDIIVTDNGTQFTSSQFTIFLQERDIKHERTAMY